LQLELTVHEVMTLSCTKVQLAVLVPVVTVNGTPLLATPPTVTTTLPVVAPAGTCAVMLVALHPVGVAVVPLNLTVLVPCVPPKFVPAIATEVPTGPAVGLRLVMLGAGAEFTVRTAALLVAVPAVFVTTTRNVEPLSAIVVTGVV
jgi:hypothetical protein